MKPCGVQFAMAITPPGRQTRRSSAAARAWSAVNMTPKVESTTSKLASEKLKDSASSTLKSIVSQSRSPTICSVVPTMA